MVTSATRSTITINDYFTMHAYIQVLCGYVTANHEHELFNFTSRAQRIKQK